MVWLIDFGPTILLHERRFHSFSLVFFWGGGVFLSSFHLSLVFPFIHQGSLLRLAGTSFLSEGRQTGDPLVASDWHKRRGCLLCIRWLGCGDRFPKASALETVSHSTTTNRPRRRRTVGSRVSLVLFRGQRARGMPTLVMNVSTLLSSFPGGPFWFRGTMAGWLARRSTDVLLLDGGVTEGESGGGGLGKRGKKAKKVSLDSLRAVERSGGKHRGCTSSLSDLHTLR